MPTPAATPEQLEQFIADVSALAADVKDPAVSARIGPVLVLQVQSIAAAVRQRFVSPPADAV